jgi:PucR C-terminal helix-turn-helix domain/GGDEF-like domain
MRIRVDSSQRDLLQALDGRRVEISQVVLDRVRAIGELAQNGDSDYLDGLRSAVEAGIDHTIEAVASRGPWPLEIPEDILAQTRLAARRRVPLETVLRRYLAGHAVLGDFIAEEAARIRISPWELRDALRSTAAETDRVLESIGSAYGAVSAEPDPRASERLRADSIRRLLAGELLDPGSLDYEFEDRFHLGLVARGPHVDSVIASLTRALQGRSLVVRAEETTVWAWFANQSSPEAGQLARLMSNFMTVDSDIGIGEPVRGRAGWRLTHHQAAAAYSVATRMKPSVALYADVAIIASAIKDELLVTSLRTIYLDPLKSDEVLRLTLLAYFKADRSVSSAAAALGVSRNTITNRIKVVESKIGHLSPARATDLSLALRLETLSSPDRPI